MMLGSALAGYFADKFSRYHSASFMASILILANFVCLETPPVVWRFEITWLLQVTITVFSGPKETAQLSTLPLVMPSCHFLKIK